MFPSCTPNASRVRWRLVWREAFGVRQACLQFIASGEDFLLVAGAGWRWFTVEWSGSANMLRSMASDVSALSGIVANGHQTCTSFLPPPLKFRTVGFPQYGFKPASGRSHLRTEVFIGCHCGSHQARRLFRSRPKAKRHRALLTPPLVQWPLAPRPVILSEQLFAYYGHIRDSGVPLRLMDYARRVLEPQRFPNLLRESFGLVSFPVPRRFPWLHVTVASP